LTPIGTGGIVAADEHHEHQANPTEAVQKRRCASRAIGMRAPTRGAFPRLGEGVRQCVQWDF